MSDLVKWVTEKFGQPLPLLLFALGTVLLLLGVTTGVDLPVLKELRPDVEHRWVALAFGALLLLSSVVLYYFPPSPVAIVRPKAGGETADDTAEHFARLEQDPSASHTQEAILALMLESTRPEQLIRGEEIRRRIREKIGNLNKASDSELYYRLEQLFWMGFLVKQTIGRDHHLYGVSDGYRKYLASREHR